MTIHERIEVLETKEPGREAFVVLFRAAGTAQPFDIDAVVDDNGNAQIDMSERHGEGTSGLSLYRGPRSWHRHMIHSPAAREQVMDRGMCDDFRGLK